MLVFGAVAEVWFRTVMPAAEMPDQYQQQPASINRFDPYRSTVGLNTIGRLCLHGGWWHINNAGWNSDVEYGSAAERNRPLVALFGDCNVVGFSSDADNHIDAYLPRLLPGTDCYAFAARGWYLEQYVAVGRYAQERFQPDVLVIFISRGDVVHSLRTNGVVDPQWWQVGTRGESFEELPPTAVYTMTRKVLLAKKSALLRYLRFNAMVTLPGMQNASVAQPGAEGRAQGQAGAASTARPAGTAWRSLVPAAAFMIGRICTRHPGVPVVFVANDASPNARYLPVKDIARTPLPPDTRAVQVASRAWPRCSFLDLRYAFSRDWAAHHIRFEAADGDHLNAYANRLVARTLADFITRNRFLPQAK